MLRSGVGWSALALVAIFVLDVVDAEPTEGEQSGTPTITPSPTTAEESPLMKQTVPQRILDPILNEAAALAKVPREQLAIVHAESVVWNDGSLGCPEPGMMYTQALLNGYWVIIDAAGRKYDYRVGSAGSFRLCPEGRGQPPSQSRAD
jgi:hypothetical protein